METSFMNDRFDAKSPNVYITKFILIIYDFLNFYFKFVIKSLGLKQSRCKVFIPGKFPKKFNDDLM